MSNPPKDYAKDVAENTLAYVRELQDELSRLRAALGSAEIEHRRVVAETELLHRELAEYRAQGRQLQELLSKVERERADMMSRYNAVARDTASLANLYVTSYRLHESLERSVLLEVLQEAVISLLGSEDFVVLEPQSDGLREIVRFGASDAQVAWAKSRPPVIEKSLASRDIYMWDGREPLEQVAAVIPLCRQDTVEGLVVVFSLLPHKLTFLQSDRELLQLLRTHVATALYCAELHARAAGGSP